jgi:predicted RNase H-like HicB family nuclease
VEPLATKTGIVVYQRADGDWVIDFPDGYHKYGRTTPAEVVSLFAYLAEGKTLEDARRKVGWRGR